MPFLKPFLWVQPVEMYKIQDFSKSFFQTLVGPLAAFFTFIGSMGNIPLAALLFDHGVSFAGVMAFIFSDLVVFSGTAHQCKILRLEDVFIYPGFVAYLPGNYLSSDALWFCRA